MLRFNEFLYRVFALSFALFVASPAFSASRSTCPDKVLDEGRIEGVYQGMEAVERCYVHIKLDNGEVFSLLADEDYVIKTFGENTGQRVSVAYKVEQTWYEPANECLRFEVMTQGKMLATAPAQTAPSSAAQAGQSAAPVSTLPAAKKQIKSIDDGFRGVPWGIETKEAEGYGLKFDPRNSGRSSMFIKSDENMSLGTVPLAHVFYAFNFLEALHIEKKVMFFNAVVIHARPEYAKPLSEECIKLFGKPTLRSHTALEWDSPTVLVKYLIHNNGVVIGINRKAKSDPPQRGGGL